MDNGPYIVTPYQPKDRPLRYKLEIRARFAGKKVRRFFNTEGEAYEEGDRLTGQIREKGTSSLAATGLSVAGAIKRFWAIRGAKIKGKLHRKHLEDLFKLFADAYGSQGIKSIGPMELSKFWNRDEWPDGKSTRWNAFVHLRMLFNCLEKHDLIDKNPVRRVEPPTKPKPLNDIVTPAQMKVALKVEDKEALAAICLQGFAGLRGSEAQRVDPAKDFDWKAKEIRVVGSDDEGGRDEKPGAAGERYVKMEPAFIRHCPKKFNMPGLRMLQKRITRAIQASSVGALEQNALRHSWFTYHYAKYKNETLTAYEGGNSPDMVKRVYTLPSKKANQRAYWAL